MAAASSMTSASMTSAAPATVARRLGQAGAGRKDQCPRNQGEPPEPLIPSLLHEMYLLVESKKTAGPSETNSQPAFEIFKLELRRTSTIFYATSSRIARQFHTNYEVAITWREGFCLLASFRFVEPDPGNPFWP
jgi:hypothetical protein